MRVGVLGGTFNPIHNSHLAMGQCAMDQLALEQVLMMVAADPPHKDVADGVSADQRLAMARLACRGRKGLLPCDLEIKRGGKSYTAQSLLQLKERLGPEAELFLILGSDSLRELPLWWRPEEIVCLCTIAAVPRLGQEDGDLAAGRALTDAWGAKLTFLPPCAEAISSTCIRSRIEDALPTEEYLPFPVEFYAYEEGLYFPEEIRSIQLKLRSSLRPPRYRHTMSTVLQAVRLAARWGEDGKRARLAALLHDCAKDMEDGQLHSLSPDASHVRAVEHAFAGPEVARRDYGVTDEAVLEAVRLHCTGDAGMTLLDQIVYLADATEPTRDYPHVEEYRSALALGPKEAMKQVLSGTAAHIGQKGFPMHPATLRALKYFGCAAGANQAVPSSAAGGPTPKP